MRIDLKKDFGRIIEYIATRCKDFPKYVNSGPGQDEDSITLITLGYQFDQAGWVALVFDTRSNAQVDGVWQNYIQENAQPFNGWYKAFNDMIENDSILWLTEHGGIKRSFRANDEMEDIAQCFGKMCRDALLQAHEDGLFKKLPLATDCRLCVEEHEGYYGWIDTQVDDEIVDEDEVQRNLQQAAKNLPKEKQIKFWIDHLNQLAAGQPCEASKLFDSEEFVLKELLKLGNEAILAVLEWTNTWADKSEFKPLSEVEEGKDRSYPHQYPVCMAFQVLGLRKKGPPEAEKLIQQYIRTATKVAPVAAASTSAKNKPPSPLYGINSWHAAGLLHEWYNGYPEARNYARTNQLRDIEKFIGKDGVDEDTAQVKSKSKTTKRKRI